MRRQRQAIVAKECDATVGNRAAQEGAGGSGLCVQSVTVIASMNVIQVTNDSRDAVVRFAGKGTFLIRHRRDRLSNQCPLLCYEVRRIDVGGHLGQYDRPEYNQESDGQLGGDGVTHQTAAIPVSVRFP